jgi:hypothetical protein
MIIIETFERRCEPKYRPTPTPVTIRMALLMARLSFVDISAFSNVPVEQPDHERSSGAALKKAIEAVLSDIELDLQSETAARSRARV